MSRVLGQVFKADGRLVETELARLISEVEGVTLFSSIEGRWYKLVYRSKFPLTQTEIDQARIPGFQRPPYYEYMIWLAVSHHVLVLASNFAVIESFAVRHLRRQNVHLRRTQVRVTEFVRDVLADPPNLVLTHIHARIGGFGESLKTISLWGNDLGDAQFVRDSSSIFFATQCGIRGRDEDRELLRLTNEGRVSAFFEDGRLKAIEGVLQFLNARQYFID